MVTYSLGLGQGRIKTGQVWSDQAGIGRGWSNLARGVEFGLDKVSDARGFG